MISVVIPTLNAERSLAASLTALVPASVEGVVREVIIVDGGSSDATLKIADDAGAKVISSLKGRGCQLATGGRQAKGPWLLFLHADTKLDWRWSRDAELFMRRFEGQQKAAAFRFALDDEGLSARAMEFMVGWRSSLLKLPYGDQGLLIQKTFYDQVGGFSELPLMEDVEIVRRIGGKRLTILPAKALTSATRYLEHGYLSRITRNLMCLGLYFAGVAPQKILKRYEPDTGCKSSSEAGDGHS
jgi:rSAM/selenodomain-associated transferase 2